MVTHLCRRTNQVKKERGFAEESGDACGFIDSGKPLTGEMNKGKQMRLTRDSKNTEKNYTKRILMTQIAMIV